MIQGEASFPWNMPNLTTLHMECQYFFVKNEYLFDENWRSCQINAWKTREFCNADVQFYHAFGEWK